MSCSRPGGVGEVLLVAAAAGRLGERAGVAGDGGRVARGHAVAQGERLEHAREHAELERGELLGPALGAQQLADQVLEDDEHEREQRERGEARLAVEDRDADGEHRAGQLGRQHRDEDLAHLAADGDAQVHRDVERDHREVEDVGQHEGAEDDEREGEVVRLEVGDGLERLDPEPDHERDRRVDGQVRQQLVPGEPVAQRVDEHRDEPDHHRGRRPAQRHREHEREERAGDPLRRVLEREQVAGDREPEQDEHEADRLPLGGIGRQRGCDQRADEDHGLHCEQPLGACCHEIVRRNAHTGPRPLASLVQRAALCRNCVFRAARATAAARARRARRARGSRRGTTRRARGTRRRGA